MVRQFNGSTYNQDDRSSTCMKTCSSTRRMEPNGLTATGKKRRHARTPYTVIYRSIASHMNVHLVLRCTECLRPQHAGNNKAYGPSSTRSRNMVQKQGQETWLAIPVDALDGRTASGEMLNGALRRVFAHPAQHWISYFCHVPCISAARLLCLVYLLGGMQCCGCSRSLSDLILVRFGF